MCNEGLVKVNIIIVPYPQDDIRDPLEKQYGCFASAHHLEAQLKLCLPECPDMQRLRDTPAWLIAGCQPSFCLKVLQKYPYTYALHCKPHLLQEATMWGKNS
jgi:hypothetical protein